MRRTRLIYRVVMLLVVLAVLIVISSLISCEEPNYERRVKAQSCDYNRFDKIIEGDDVYYSVGESDFKTNGMKYKIFSTTNGKISVVNITKDSLECELMKKENKIYKNIEDEQNF